MDSGVMMYIPAFVKIGSGKRVGSRNKIQSLPVKWGKIIIIIILRRRRRRRRRRGRRRTLTHVAIFI
jgi:hypothetical protein